jgi:serine/threonine-protein kinase
MLPDNDLTMTTPLGVATRGEARRLPTGSIVAGRYRLVALLGKGGMGEVYRAEDLTLDQPVALKFLPTAVVGDSVRLTQFHNELRVARQVSHKNVVRLYDLGEADGRPFLTMEYVDGEDLGALLRRIGRIPADKAIDIARQLCAGVAAAHERGVIHRDLKPANVMLDGDGNVRITDFGIATATVDAGADVVGTPQYMAPELLRGAGASVRTDIYALGLILFEIFTGRRAFDAKTIGELKKLHDTQPLTTPSSIVRDLDPTIERVILRCIDRDAAKRPGSALAVAAALPGGDPLAEALAAGETPSPGMLVAAGETEAMPLRPALAMATAFVAVLLLAAAFAPRGSLIGLVPLAKPTDVLADRAEQLIASFGYDDQPMDRARGFTVAADPLRWAQNQGSRNWWPTLGSGTPPAVVFWYRTSPRDLVPDVPAGTVSASDPPLITTGQRLLLLDTRGRLQEFHEVPPQLESDMSQRGDPNWHALFEAAGLDMGTFAPTTPQWTPPHFADTRAAWSGPSPDRPDIALRVEAAAYRGRPTSFYVIGPWSRPTRMVPPPRTATQILISAANVALSLLVLAVGAVLARRNLRANRADRTGAGRLGMWLIGLQLTGWLLAAHYVSTPDAQLRELLFAIAFICFFGAFVWALYLAVEPYARRLWPDGLIGWTRFLSGHVNDPRVGRDILIGLTLAAATIAIEYAQTMLPVHLGYAAPRPAFGNLIGVLASPTLVVSRWISALQNSMQSSLVVASILIVIRLMFKRAWVAAIVGVGVLVILTDGGAAISGTVIDLVGYTMVISIAMFVLVRFGLLALVIGSFVDNVVTTMPMTLRLSAWWATPAALSLALLVGIAVFGVYAATQLTMDT